MCVDTVSRGNAGIARGLWLAPAWHLGTSLAHDTQESILTAATALELQLYLRWPLLSLVKVCLCLPPTPDTPYHTPVCRFLTQQPPPHPVCRLYIAFQPWCPSQLLLSIDTDYFIILFLMTVFVSIISVRGVHIS